MIKAKWSLDTQHKVNIQTTYNHMQSEVQSEMDKEILGSMDKYITSNKSKSFNIFNWFKSIWKN